MTGNRLDAACAKALVTLTPLNVPVRKHSRAAWKTRRTFIPLKRRERPPPSCNGRSSSEIRVLRLRRRLTAAPAAQRRPQARTSSSIELRLQSRGLVGIIIPLDSVGLRYGETLPRAGHTTSYSRKLARRRTLDCYPGLSLPHRAERPRPRLADIGCASRRRRPASQPDTGGARVPADLDASPGGAGPRRARNSRRCPTTTGL